MRHKERGRKLGHSSAHNRALARSILRALFIHGQIITTRSRAKEYAPLANRMITFAKRAEQKVEEMEAKMKKDREVTPELTEQITRQAKVIRLAYFRHMLSKLPDKKLVHKIFYEIAPLFKDRKGGYTSINHLNKDRLGDNAKRAVLKLVARPAVSDEKKDDKHSDAEKKDNKNKEKSEEKEKMRREKEKKRIQEKKREKK